MAPSSAHVHREASLGFVISTQLTMYEQIFVP
jgi:hypothetical protein